MQLIHFLRSSGSLIESGNLWKESVVPTSFATPAVVSAVFDPEPEGNAPAPEASAGPADPVSESAPYCKKYLLTTCRAKDVKKETQERCHYLTHTNV